MEISAATSSFLTHVKVEKGLASNTVAAYRDTFRLLFGYLKETTGKTPSIICSG